MEACLGSSMLSLSLLLFSINQVFHHSFGARLYKAEPILNKTYKLKGATIGDFVL